MNQIYNILFFFCLIVFRSYFEYEDNFHQNENPLGLNYSSDENEDNNETFPQIFNDDDDGYEHQNLNDDHQNSDELNNTHSSTSLKIGMEFKTWDDVSMALINYAQQIGFV